MTMRFGVLAIVFLSFPFAADAADDCGAKWNEMSASKRALRECLRSGAGCQDAYRRRDAAEAAVVGCPEPPPGMAPGATPTQPSPASSTGRVAVIAEGDAPGMPAVEDAVRSALDAETLIGKGETRSARVFLDLGDETDDAEAEKLRKELAAVRIYFVQVKSQGRSRFVSVKAVDPGGVTRRYIESSDATIAADTALLVSDMPKEIVYARPEPAPEPTPRAVSATPAATPPPTRTGPSGPPGWSPSGGDETAGAYLDLDLFLGNKRLNEDDWGALDSQNEFAFRGTWGPSELWAIYLALDYYASFGSANTAGAKSSATTGEYSIGLRKVIASGAPRLQLGAGIAFLDATVISEAESSVGSVRFADHGRGVGGWASVAGSLRLGEYFNLGAELRASAGNVRLGGESVSAGGIHVGVFLGWGRGGPRGSSDYDEP